jgi:uncharacterized protein (TIGR02246 family)
MRIHALAPFAAVAALLACRAMRPEPLLEPEFHGTIRELNRELERRFRDGDLLGVADLYADDALMLGPDGRRVEGREAIDAYWARISEPRDWRLDVREIGGSSAAAYELGRSTLTIAPGGEPRTAVVDFLVLWRPEGDSYRIVLDMYWTPDDAQR